MIFWEKRRDQKHIASLIPATPPARSAERSPELQQSHWIDFSSNAADGYGTCILFHIPRNWVKRLLSICCRSVRHGASFFLHSFSI
ncbi:hypothetical protein QL093DRAFT_2262464 [Fusarium oxysporum]|nr:hypothetical protein QL093DRAFT_2262464 [Fusarium oxysporum]